MVPLEKLTSTVVIRRKWSRLAWVTALWTLLLASPALRAQTPYQLGVHTSLGNDTLYKGIEGSIIFSVDSAGSEPVLVFNWSLEFRFSYANFVGDVDDGQIDTNATFVHTPGFWGKAVRDRQWVTQVDTILAGIFYLFDPYWTGSGEQWRVTFVPSDTGTLIIDSAWAPPAHELTAFTPDGQPYPLSWQPHTVTVVPYCGTGDVNATLSITSSDVIYTVNHVFKGGPEPLPCVALGDTNCSGSITSADIIVITNHIFKGGPPPCNSCPLVEQGVWLCP